MHLHELPRDRHAQAQAAKAVTSAMLRVIALLKSAIERSPAGLKDQELLSEAWKLIEPQYLARLAALVDQYHSSQPRGLATNNLREAVRAARDGRVGVLLIESDNGASQGKKSLSTSNGARAAALEGDDPLDDLAEAVLRTKGTVVVVPRERMPSPTGLAATFRY